MALTYGEARALASATGEGRHNPEEIIDVVIMYTTICPNGGQHPHVYASGTLDREETRKLLKEAYELEK